MKLCECTEGDIVVVELERRRAWVEVGALLGDGPRKRKNRRVTRALVHVLDHESLRPQPRDAQLVSADLDVVAVVATAAYLRSMRAHRVLMRDDEHNVDPLQRWTREARRQGWNEEPF